MMTLIDSMIGKIGAAVGIFGAVLGTFITLDKWTSKSAKQDFASYLKQTDFGQVTAHIPSGLRELFERIFGQKHFSMRCLFSSFLFSLGALGLLLVLYVMDNPHGRGPAFSQAFLWFTRIEIIQIFVISFVADYFNLLKTRLVISHLPSWKWHMVPLVIVVVVDFLLGFFIYVFWMLLASNLADMVQSLFNVYTPNPINNFSGYIDFVSRLISHHVRYGFQWAIYEFRTWEVFNSRAPRTMTILSLDLPPLWRDARFHC